MSRSLWWGVIKSTISKGLYHSFDFDYNYNNRDISRFLKKIKHLRNVKLISNLSVNKEVNAVTCTAILTEVSSDEARLRMYSCTMSSTGPDSIHIDK